MGFAGGSSMRERQGDIVVGILGQWASGKSAAARILIDHLGGEGEVVFINDAWLLAGQVVNHILELDESDVTRSLEADGRLRLVGSRATLWLGRGEDLETVELSTLQFDVPDSSLWDWLNRARAEIGHQLRRRSAEGKPIIIEAGFGTNTEPTGEDPYSHTIADLFATLQQAGVEPNHVKWIVVEAGYAKRAERNQQRLLSVPADMFDRYAADGGDLEAAQQRRWEAQGAVIKRVQNDHDDIDRFSGDVVAAFEAMFA
jgi:hypothetical protein